LAGDLVGDFSIDFWMPLGAETALAVGFFVGAAPGGVLVVVVGAAGLSCA